MRAIVDAIWSTAGFTHRATGKCWFSLLIHRSPQAISKGNSHKSQQLFWLFVAPFQLNGETGSCRLHRITWDAQNRRQIMYVCHLFFFLG
jgi:hypothetical protein